MEHDENKKDWRDELAELYPKTLLTPHWRPPHALHRVEMCIDDGWRHIIAALCRTLHNIHLNHGVYARAAQIKEKFGGLRFYVDMHVDPDIILTKQRKWVSRILDTRPWFNKRRGLLRYSKFGLWLSKFEFKYYKIRGYNNKLQPPRRVDLNYYFGELSGAIAMAEVLASHTCEICGAVGNPVTMLRTDGWWKTWCDKCHQEHRGNKQENEDEIDGISTPGSAPEMDAQTGTGEKSV